MLPCQAEHASEAWRNTSANQAVTAAFASVKNSGLAQQLRRYCETGTAGAMAGLPQSSGTGPVRLQQFAYGR